jgi:hypothetical protein
VESGDENRAIVCGLMVYLFKGFGGCPDGSVAKEQRMMLAA